MAQTQLGSAYGEIRIGTGGVQKAVDTANNALGGMKSSLSSTVSLMGGAVVGATAVLAGGLAAVTASGVSMAMSLEEQMSRIQAVLGASAEEVKLLEDEIVNLGLNPNLKVTTEEAAAAIEMLGRNGLKTTDILNGAAEATVLLANATGADFAVAADIGTDAMAIFNIEAADMLGAVSGISSVTTNSKFSINDYALALAQAGGVASSSGVEFDDFNTSIAAISPLFASGSDAGTSFKTMLQRIANPTDEAASLMNQLGLEFFDAQGNMKGMAEISEMMNQAFMGTSEVLVEVGGRTAEQNAELARMQDAYTSAQQSIRDYELNIKGAGLTEEARAEKIEQLRGQMALLEGNMAPLIDIQGEMTSSTVALTEEQRNQYLAILFGSDATRAATGLMEAGAAANLTAAEAAEIFGISMEEATKMVEDGITEFEILQATMGETDALESAAIRMDNLKGVMEILGGIFDAVKLKIGQGFIPILRFLADRALELSERALPQIEAAMDRLAGFVQLLTDNFDTLVAYFRYVIEDGDYLNDMLTHLPESIQPVVKDIGEFVARLIEIAEPIATAVASFVSWQDVLVALGIFVGGFLLSALYAIATAIAPIILIVGAVIGVVALLRNAWERDWGGIQEKVETAREIIGGLSPIFDDVRSFIGGFTTELGNGLGVWDAAVEALLNWTNVGESNSEMILNAVTAIETFVTKIRGGIVGVISQLVAWWQTNWKTIQAVLMTAWIVIQSVIQSALAVIRPAIQTFVDNARSGLESFGPALESLGALWQALQPIIAVVLAVIGALILAFVGVVVGLFSGIAAAIEPFLTTLSFIINGLVIAVTGVAEFLTGLVQYIIALFQGNEEAATAAWQKMNEGLTKIVLGLVEAIVGAFLGLAMTIATLIHGLVTGVIDFFTNLYETLVGGSIIPDMVNAIILWITNMVTWFTDLVLQLVTAVILNFQQLLIAVGSKVIQLVSQIKTKLMELKAAWDEKWAAIKAKVLEIWDAIKSAVLSKIVTLKSSVLAKIDEIRSGIAGKIAAFRSVGSDLMEGMKNGIVSKANALVSAAKGVVNDAIAAARNLLGISSPSKLFTGFGVDTIRGLINGVVSLKDRLASSMRNTLGPMVDEAQRRAAMASQFTGVPNLAMAGAGTAVPSSVDNSQRSTQHFHIDKIVLQEVQDAQGLLAGLKDYTTGGENY